MTRDQLLDPTQRTALWESVSLAHLDAASVAAAPTAAERHPCAPGPAGGASGASAGAAVWGRRRAAPVPAYGSRTRRG
jgi:hypothetical protein